MSEPRSAVFNDAVRTLWMIALCVNVLGISTMAAQSDETSNHAGGEVTIVAGAKNDVVQVRSTRFR
jgi:hypothetical protein